MKQTKTKHETREQWLEAAVRLMVPLFKGKDYEVPTVKVSCGFPSGRALSRKKQAIGECWGKDITVDGVPQIFVSPIIKDPIEVLAILVHEVVHAVVGSAAKHGSKFRKCALAVGLEGKMTATHAGDELTETAGEWIKELGQYPHAGLKPKARPEKKQTTRMVKCECKKCGYTVRVSRKWLDESGAALCPCNAKPMSFELPPELEPKDEDEDDE
jgi:hypothetical protein